MDSQELNNTGLICSETGSPCSLQFQEPEGMKFLRIVLEICIGIFGICGNLLVCIAIASSKRLHTVGNIFIFSLSVADLGVLLVCLPLVILNTDVHYSWPFGEIGCKILLPLTDVFYGVSIGSIVGISFHRYRMIVHCMSRQLTGRKAKFMVVLIWIFSYLLFVLPLHFVVELKTVKGKDSCQAIWIRPLHRQLHVIFVTTLFYILPLAIILCTYLRIRRKLSVDSFLNSQMQHDPTNTVKKRLEQNKKALRILTPVVVAFSLFMLPINAIRLAAAFGKNLHLNFAYLRLVYNISVLFLLANSSVNCIIYAVVNKDFRSEFKRIICCACLKRIYTPTKPRARFYSLYSTTDPKTVQEMLSEGRDSVFNDEEDEEMKKTGRMANLIRKLSRYEVRNLMEDTDYEDAVHYCAYGENVTIVVR